VFDSLPASEKVSYRQLSFMFDENLSASPDKKKAKPRAKLTEVQNRDTIPMRTPYRRSTELRNIRKSSLDLDFNQYYLCDEPELMEWRSFASVMEQIDPALPREETVYPYSIFVSGLAAANDFTQLSHHSIKAVLSLGAQNEPAHYPTVTGGYLTIPLETDTQDLRPHFNAAFRFLEVNLQRANVLVHCFHGISRSCAVVAGFFIKTYKFNTQQAMGIVQSSRRQIMITPSLIRELEAFALERGLDN
jgi:dual specificity phosphatase 12